ncbi:MAG: DNA primase [Clostridia bacterium]|nr:DNA primase [Clostridia bacterium]
MKISQDFVEELKFRNRIEDVVSGYVTLKRAGSNLTGLCPFHSEKTPSFFVSPVRNTFHCFGCGVGGDVITFVMRTENLDYISAIETLAKRVGMEMPADTSDRKNELVRRGRIYDMNKCAARFFNSSLSGEDAVPAREYLQKRGLTSLAVKRFGLGFAPPKFDALRNHLRSEGYRDEEAKEAFLCGKSERTGNYFDLFRNRLIFPIIDNFGNVIGFGGRAIDDDTQPKYLNSSDTPVFKKSLNLFALNYARTACSEYMILCEGYMDTIAMHMAGFTNAVATLGTALTTEQARILAKYTKKVVLSYDSDEAGVKATKRAIPILADVGLEVKVLQINDAKDPDEYIKKFGADKFRMLVEGSRSKLDFLCDSVMKKYDISVPDEKIKASNELCEQTAAIYSDVERDVYIARIAEKLGISAAGFRNDVDRLRRRNTKKEDAQRTDRIIAQTMGFGDRVNRERSSNVKAARAEEAVLGIILTYPEMAVKVKNGDIALTVDDFVTEFNRRVFAAVISDDGGTDLGMLSQIFNVDEISRIQSMMEGRADLNRNDEKTLIDNINALHDAAEIKSEQDDIAATMKLIQKKKNNHT